jgi:mono/diheme cytochrome c family protein
MRTRLTPLLLLILCLVGCEQDPTVKRDIVLEVAAANQDLFESPKTRAEELYSRYCSVCHGINGQGDGFNAFNLDPKPRNFTDSTFKARMDTILIKEVISGGGGVAGLSRLMPMWGNTLSERDISELADFVVHLATQQSQ